MELMQRKHLSSCMLFRLLFSQCACMSAACYLSECTFICHVCEYISAVRIFANMLPACFTPSCMCARFSFPLLFPKSRLPSPSSLLAVSLSPSLLPVSPSRLPSPFFIPCLSSPSLLQVSPSYPPSTVSIPRLPSSVSPLCVSPSLPSPSSLLLVSLFSVSPPRLSFTSLPPTSLPLSLCLVSPFPSLIPVSPLFSLLLSSSSHLISSEAKTLKVSRNL
jgi:hypothetical protein